MGPEVCESELDGEIDYEKNDSDPIVESYFKYSGEIKDSINLNYKLLIAYRIDHDLDPDTESTIVDIVENAIRFGLKEENINDFTKFIIAELLLILIEHGDSSTLADHKNDFIGRCFAINDQ